MTRSIPPAVHAHLAEENVEASTADVAHMQASYRELLPAPSRRSDSPKMSDAENDKSQLVKRKGKLVKIACRVCQRRRVKCDGLRPGCSTCKKRGEVCLYDFDAAADTTRYQALRKKHIELEQSSNQNSEVLDLLRQRPRSEALAIFEHIRRGDSLKDLLRAVQDGDTLVGLSSHPNALEPLADTKALKEQHVPVELPPLVFALASLDREKHIYVQNAKPWPPLRRTEEPSWYQK